MDTAHGGRTQVDAPPSSVGRPATARKDLELEMRTLLRSGPTTSAPRHGRSIRPGAMLLRLQRTAGNAAVSQWWRSRAGQRHRRRSRAAPTAAAPARTGRTRSSTPRDVKGIHRAPGSDSGRRMPGYDKGEQVRSRSAAGIMGKDVVPRGPALLVADFGIDQSAVKAQARNDADLQAWLAAFENDSSTGSRSSASTTASATAGSASGCASSGQRRSAGSWGRDAEARAGGRRRAGRRAHRHNTAAAAGR